MFALSKQTTEELRGKTRLQSELSPPFNYQLFKKIHVINWDRIESDSKRLLGSQVNVQGEHSIESKTASFLWVTFVSTDLDRT